MLYDECVELLRIALAVVQQSVVQYRQRRSLEKGGHHSTPKYEITERDDTLNNIKYLKTADTSRHRQEDTGVNKTQRRPRPTANWKTEKKRTIDDPTRPLGILENDTAKTPNEAKTKTRKKHPTNFERRTIRA